VNVKGWLVLDVLAAKLISSVASYSIAQRIEFGFHPFLASPA
jgi:hypothetical protein